MRGNMKKKLKSFLSLVSTAIGCGLIYVASSGSFSASADSTIAAETNQVALMVTLVLGIILVIVGVMAAVFLFASNSEN